MPEFHASNTVRWRTGEARPVTPPTEMSESEYKAILYINLFGGMDSFNVLTPHNNGGICFSTMTTLKLVDSKKI